MQLHNLSHSKKVRKRVGRGGKRGTYSGRGNKGQNARSGNKVRAGFAGGDTTLFKRMPKKRGSVGHVGIKRGIKKKRIKTVVLNLDKVSKRLAKQNFKVISPRALVKAGLLKRIGGKTPKVKFLGKGDLKVRRPLKGIQLSKGAKKKLFSSK